MRNSTAKTSPDGTDVERGAPGSDPSAPFRRQSAVNRAGLSKCLTKGGNHVAGQKMAAVGAPGACFRTDGQSHCSDAFVCSKGVGDGGGQAMNGIKTRRAPSHCGRTRSKVKEISSDKTKVADVPHRHTGTRAQAVLLGQLRSNVRPIGRSHEAGPFSRNTTHRRTSERANERERRERNKSARSYCAAQQTCPFNLSLYVYADAPLRHRPLRITRRCNGARVIEFHCPFAK